MESNLIENFALSGKNFPILDSVYAARNSIKKLEFSSKSVTYLDLSGNQLQKMEPLNCSKMGYLYLDDNRLDDIEWL